MNSLKSAALLGLAVIAIASCRKKEKPQPVVPPGNDTAVFRPVFNFLPLHAGNYWIYETFSIDSLGVATSTHEYDSCYVTEDTVMQGYKTLVKRVLGNRQTLFLKQDGTSIVDHLGNVHFSQDYTSVFFQRWVISPIYEPNDTLAYVKHFMGERNKLTTVPAGSFHTTAFIEEYNMQPPWDKYGKKRSYYHRYANGIGIVSETAAFYLESPVVYERRLVRYDVRRKQ
jgi:hypothetical protein